MSSESPEQKDTEFRFRLEWMLAIRQGKKGAAEVVNCRCALLQRARWAMDKDFKKKYFKIAKGLENSGNSDKILNRRNNLEIDDLFNIDDIPKGVAKEIMHRRNRKYLTGDERRKIISAVKEAYPTLNWRKGGTLNAKKFKRKHSRKIANR